MEQHKFYEINSEKSQIFENDLKQITFACENWPDAFCFLWINREDRLIHFQMLFEEKVIDWFPEGEKIGVGQTNRAFFHPVKPGITKGVRTIHSVKDDKILQEGWEIFQNADFPEAFQKYLRDINFLDLS